MNTGARLVVANEEWASILPVWLLEEVREEQWIILMQAAQGEMQEYELVGDAETLTYLLTLCQIVPFSSERTNIFLSLMFNVLERKKSGMPSTPDFVRPEKLTAVEQQELKRIKQQLYEARRRAGYPLMEFALSGRPSVLKRKNGS